ncbi:general secretion pathway protein GspB [Hydrogenophaga sp.]|uniref:general secretion pathway protein GspB n=1 Tax=Hydrogenophaga sp. TaxID=1904254 RepID=UPI0035B39533
MSYILDALRRADAERELGRVPKLNSPTVASAPERRPQDQARRRAVRLAAWLAGVAVAGVVVWWAWPADTPTDTPTNAPTSAAPAPANTVPVPPAPPAPPADVAPPPAPQATAVVPLLAPPPPPAPTKPATPSAEASAPATGQATAAPSHAKTGNSANSAKGAEPAETLPRLADLPAEQRAQLPALNLSGATYAENPALRMLIANGRVVQEGQEAAPGVVLESIGPRSAVLNHRGTRFRVPY